MKLKDLGERKIIDILSNITALSYKDDCSFIDNGDSYFLLTTDVIGEKTHMPKGADPYLIGQFFASINLSDIAAMAGKPVAFMTAYSLSPETEMDFLESLERGMVNVLKEYDTDFIGGDLKEGCDKSLTGIAIGEQTKKLTRKRSDIAEG
ncbi:MAG: AIR synthase related protein, partial [Thermoplasmata archaeon]